MCALCDLPINAIILIFIHEMLNGYNVPITRTGLYTLMISNFLVRHMKAPSVQQYRGPIRDIERDLPPEIDRKLRKLCLLAYNAVSSNKNVMTYSELMKEGMEKPDESFGLLQIKESVTVYGPEFIYSFPHLSIQEFLAAIHIKRIGNEDEEASAIKRKLRIDELPQIINVLKGEMSFVGPRPERPYFVEQLCNEVPYYNARHSIKPGITGWAQVRYRYGSSVKDAIEKLQYDLYYVKNHSLFLDIIIIIDTIEVVVLGKGGR